MAHAQNKQQQAHMGKLSRQVSLSKRDAVMRKKCHLGVPFQLQVNAREHEAPGLGKAHLAPGMHFQQAPPTYSGQLLASCALHRRWSLEPWKSPTHTVTIKALPKDSIRLLASAAPAQKSPCRLSSNPTLSLLNLWTYAQAGVKPIVRLAKKVITAELQSQHSLCPEPGRGLRLALASCLQQFLYSDEAMCIALLRHRMHLLLTMCTIFSLLCRSAF